MDLNGPIEYFKDPESFRDWLKKNHRSKAELWVGYYKKGSGRESMDWPQSVDQALCFGWIDGIRKSLDEISYKVRFTPRKPGSHWSKVNIDKVKFLKENGLMTEAGMEAFKGKRQENTGKALHEQSNFRIDPEYEKALKKDAKAYANFSNRSKGYQRQCYWWVMSAKKEETRQKRLEILINSSREDKVIPPLKWGKY